MRKFLQRILRKPISFLANRLSSRPNQDLVHKSLTDLYNAILKEPGKKGDILQLNTTDKIIILSDQHKGARDGADIFELAENNYLAALDYYFKNNFFYINLGDSEELWENSIDKVQRNNVKTFEKEKLFLAQKYFMKIFGNHDLYWDNDPLANSKLEEIYGQKLAIYEGALLKIPINEKILNIFLTHGHQGDLQSDGNWFSKWFVSNIWGPLEAYLEINPNIPSVNDQLKTLHNKMMYDWSAKQKDLLLITGHTHQPVFESLTHLERLYKQLNSADPTNKALIKELQDQINTRIRKGDSIPDFTAYKPTYFNSGCCCFDDGDITGIEIADGYIRLIKWGYSSDNLKTSNRLILEETLLEPLIK